MKSFIKFVVLTHHTRFFTSTDHFPNKPSKLVVITAQSGPPKHSVNSYRLWECLCMENFWEKNHMRKGHFHGEFLENDPSKIMV